MLILSSDVQITGGETNIADVLRKMRTQLFVAERGDRDDVPNIAILVTDGRANREAGDTFEQVSTVLI